MDEQIEAQNTLPSQSVLGFKYRPRRSCYSFITISKKLFSEMCSPVLRRHQALQFIKWGTHPLSAMGWDKNVLISLEKPISSSNAGSRWGGRTRVTKAEQVSIAYFTRRSMVHSRDRGPCFSYWLYHIYILWSWASFLAWACFWLKW